MHVKELILSDRGAQEHLVSELARLHPTGEPVVKIVGFDLERGKGFTSVTIIRGKKTKGVTLIPDIGYAKRMNYDTRDMRADKQNDKVGLTIALSMALRRAGIRLPAEKPVSENERLKTALAAVYQDIDLQSVPGGSNELDILVQGALGEGE